MKITKLKNKRLSTISTIILIFLVTINLFTLLTASGVSRFEFSEKFEQLDVSSADKTPIKIYTPYIEATSNEELDEFFLNHPEFKGNGLSPQTPYVIENLTIESSAIYGFILSNITRYLVFNNITFFQTNSNGSEIAFNLTKGTSNLIIKNCNFNNIHSILYAWNAFNVIIENNHITNFTGVFVSFSKSENIIIRNNHAINSNESFIFFQFSKNSSIENNYVEQSNPYASGGYSFTYVFNFKILNNTKIGGRRGLEISGGDNIVKFNCFQNTTSAGLELIALNNTIVSYNMLNYTQIAFTILFTRNISVVNNSVYYYTQEISQENNSLFTNSGNVFMYPLPNDSNPYDNYPANDVLIDGFSIWIIISMISIFVMVGVFKWSDETRNAI